MTEDLTLKLRKSPEYLRCVSFNQNNPHHHLPLDLHMQYTEENVEKLGCAYAERLLIAAMLHDIGKPEVARYDEKKGFTRFFGHAERSAEIAKRLLVKNGFTEESAEIVCWYIRHHDDFISFKTGFVQEHPFMRAITAENVAEVIFKAFINIDGAPIDINATVRFAMTGRKPSWGKILPWAIKTEDELPPLVAFKNLLVLCKADAMAQAPDSVAEKVQVLEEIEKVLLSAYNLAKRRALKGTSAT